MADSHNFLASLPILPHRFYTHSGPFIHHWLCRLRSRKKTALQCTCSQYTCIIINGICHDSHAICYIVNVESLHVLSEIPSGNKFYTFRPNWSRKSNGKKHHWQAQQQAYYSQDIKSPQIVFYCMYWLYVMLRRVYCKFPLPIRGGRIAPNIRQSLLERTFFSDFYLCWHVFKLQ